MSELKLKKLIEDNDPAQDDGQPRQNFYVPTVMVARDVIANILDKFTKAGISHSFVGDDLILKAVTYAVKLKGVEDDLTQQLADCVKFLKTEYKGITGNALEIGAKPESEDFEVVSNYTVNKQNLCTLTHVYELPQSKAEDDAGSEKGELPGNIPVFKPKNK